jgi:hypothetical protein
MLVFPMIIMQEQVLHHQMHMFSGLLQQSSQVLLQNIPALLQPPHLLQYRPVHPLRLQLVYNFV